MRNGKKRLSAYAKSLSTDRVRVMGELAEIAIRCTDPNLHDMDVKRLNLRRVTLCKIYDYITDRCKEEQTDNLIRSVEAVEHLWGHGMDDVADRESFATKFDNTTGEQTH